MGTGYDDHIRCDAPNKALVHLCISVPTSRVHAPDVACIIRCAAPDDVACIIRCTAPDVARIIQCTGSGAQRTGYGTTEPNPVHRTGCGSSHIRCTGYMTKLTISGAPDMILSYPVPNKAHIRCTRLGVHQRSWRCTTNLTSVWRPCPYGQHSVL